MSDKEHLGDGRMDFPEIGMLKRLNPEPSSNQDPKIQEANARLWDACDEGDIEGPSS